MVQEMVKMKKARLICLCMIPALLVCVALSANVSSLVPTGGSAALALLPVLTVAALPVLFRK